MATTTLRFFDLLIMALLVGTMFGIWIGGGPFALSAATYVEQQQNSIRGLNVLLPVLGAACVILTVALAVLTKGDKRGRYLYVTVAVCLIVAGLITRFANQPINGLVMTWSAQSPPANWMQLRDAWWNWHIARTLFGIAALILSLLAVLGARPTKTGPRDKCEHS